MKIQKKNKIKIGLCCFIIPIPFVAIYEAYRHHKNKKDKIVVDDKIDIVKNSREFNKAYFEKFTKNTLNEAKLKLNEEVIKALRELKEKAFTKIYELQKEVMREEEKDTLTKDYLHSEIIKDPILKNYLDNGLLNANYIALHDNLLKEKAQKMMRFFRKKVVKAYLLYNDDIENPCFNLNPIPFKNKIYISKDSKELFLLDRTIGTFEGVPLYYVVSGYPFSMEFEHGVEELEMEFNGLSNIDKRFVFKRIGYTPSDIEKKFKSIELQKELGYTFPLVKTAGIVLLTIFMTSIVTSMIWMLTIL